MFSSSGGIHCTFKSKLIWPTLAVACWCWCHNFASRFWAFRYPIEVKLRYTGTCVSSIWLNIKVLRSNFEMKMAKPTVSGCVRSLKEISILTELFQIEGLIYLTADTLYYTYGWIKLMEILTLTASLLRKECNEWRLCYPQQYCYSLKKMCESFTE